MTSTDFGNSGALARVGPIGRVVRILAGIVFLAFFFRNLTRFGGFVDFATPTNPGVWIGAAITFYFLADVVNLGFTRTWGRWPQLVALLLAVVAALFDLAYYGSVWGPPLGLVIFLMIAYVTVHLGVSFIIAGISAAPG